MICALGTVIAMPIGVLIALFLSEFATPRVAAPVRMALDLLYGLPSIVIAIFIYGARSVYGVGQSGFDASLGVGDGDDPADRAHNRRESLSLVPQGAARRLERTRERAAGGPSTGVLPCPSALGGIVTGTVLAVARAAGETAPMLLLCSLANPVTTSLNPFSGDRSTTFQYDILQSFSEEGGPPLTSAKRRGRGARAQGRVRS